MLRKWSFSANRKITIMYIIKNKDIIVKSKVTIIKSELKLNVVQHLSVH